MRNIDKIKSMEAEEMTEFLHKVRVETITRFGGFEFPRKDKLREWLEEDDEPETACGPDGCRIVYPEEMK